MFFSVIIVLVIGYQIIKYLPKRPAKCKPVNCRCKEKSEWPWDAKCECFRDRLLIGVKFKRRPFHRKILDEIWSNRNQMSVDEVRLRFRQSDSQQLPKTVQQRLFQMGRNARRKSSGQALLPSNRSSLIEDPLEVLTSPSYIEAVQRQAESILTSKEDDSKLETKMYREIRQVLESAGVEDEKIFSKIIDIGKSHREKIVEYRLKDRLNDHSHF